MSHLQIDIQNVYTKDVSNQIFLKLTTLTRNFYFLNTSIPQAADGMARLLETDCSIATSGVGAMLANARAHRPRCFADKSQAAWAEYKVNDTLGSAGDHTMYSVRMAARVALNG